MINLPVPLKEGRASGCKDVYVMVYCGIGSRGPPMSSRDDDEGDNVAASSPWTISPSKGWLCILKLIAPSVTYTVQA